MSCLLLPAWASAADSAAQRAFSTAVAWFGKGDYEKALAAFRKARAAGMNSPVLYYDLGAVNFRLGRLDAARRNFSRIVDDSRYGQYARYNLGLIAERRGHADEARHRFSQVAEHADDAALRKLARTQLERIGPPRSPRAVGFLDLESGYDSNVILRRSASAVTPSGRGSALFGVLTGGAAVVQGSWRHGLQMNGSLFYRGYTAASGYNQLLLQGGPKYRFPVGDWELQTSAAVTYFRFGSATLETTLAALVHASHPVGANGKVTLEGGLSGVRGGTNYGYLGGHTYFVGAGGKWKAGPVTLSGGYSHHVDRRNDLYTGNQFFSVSPVSNDVYAALHWQVDSRWEVAVHAGYEHARYRDPDVYLQNGLLVTERRVDNRASFRASVTRDFSDTLSVELSGEHDDNRSTVARYAYSQNVYLLRLRYLF